MLKGSKEEQYWKDFTPDMMSEEERVGDKYVRHPPSYRSKKASRFIDKLDARLSSTSDRARFNRVIGSPRNRPAPLRAKKWTINIQSTITGDNVTEIETSRSSTNPERGADHTTQEDIRDESDSEFSAASSADEEDNDTASD